MSECAGLAVYYCKDIYNLNLPVSTLYYNILDSFKEDYGEINGAEATDLDRG